MFIWFTYLHKYSNVNKTSYNITYLYMCVIQHYIPVHMCHTTLHTCTYVSYNITYLYICVIQHYIPVHMCHTTLHTCTYVSYNITYLYICVIQWVIIHYIPVHMCHTTLHTCTYVSYSGLSNPEVSKVGCCELSSGCGISSKSIGFSFWNSNDLSSKDYLYWGFCLLLWIKPSLKTLTCKWQCLRKLIITS